MSKSHSLSNGAAAGVFGLGTAAGWVTYRKIAAARAARGATAQLPPALDAATTTVDLMASGSMTVYTDRRGSGRPLVLLHGIHAAASAFEVGPFFDAYRGTRPVYAPDLPGFGMSDRHDHVYSPSLYTFAIMQLLEKIASKDVPADVIALSLSSEFAARAARDRPDLFHSLTLVSPTGFASEEPHLEEKGSIWKTLSSLPLASAGLFDLLTSRSSIRYFLAKSFAGPVDPALARYAHLTAQQPGARHAVRYFLRGDLFTKHVAEMVYEKVTVPTLVLHDLDPHSDFAKLEPFVARHPAWRSRRIAPTRGLPQFEMLNETVAAIDELWSDVSRAPSVEERPSRVDGALMR